MKKQTLFTLAMSAMLAAGCSSDNGLDTPQGGDAQGNAYISLNIQLPATSGTRAADNFDDGDANEFNVKSTTLVVFDKDNRMERVFSTTDGTLGSLTYEKDGAANITSKATTAALKVTEGEKHVVVVLNASSDFISKLPKVATLSDLFSMTESNKAITDYTGTSNNQFVMTSSPYYDGTKIVQYATVTPTTDKNAPGNATAYVERVVGKVSAKHGTADWTDWTYTIPANELRTGDKITIEKYALDVTNKSTYLFRHTDNDWTSGANSAKFVGTATPNQRIYFAKDTNYDTYDATNDFTSYVSGNEAQIAGNLADPIYCLENTFDVDHMKQDGTTRVIFKAKYVLKGKTDAETFYTIGSSVTPLTEAEFKTAIEGAARRAGVTMPTTYDLTQLKCTDEALTKAALGGEATTLSDDNITALNNALGTIHVYEGGYCYYVGRIRHFADAVAPWTVGSATYEASALGRFGVVRNNWYQLTVNTIKQIGSAHINKATDAIDDENNYYIDCTINVEPWAVNTQNSFDF